MTDNSGKNTQQWYLQTQSESLVGNGTYYLKSASTGKLVLDISGGSKSDRANVQIYTVNGTNAQQFQITHVKDGYCKIISKNSGKALEYNSGAGVNGANVYQNAWNGKNNQLWKVISVAGNYYIQTKNGGVIDIQNGTLNAGTNAQRWSFVQLDNYNGVNVSEGVYTIQSAANNAYVLDIDNASTNSGANVQLFNSNNTAAQKFSIKSVGDGYYKIQCEATGKVLDVSDGSMASNANVQQFSWNGSAAQCWKFVDAGNGNYYIQSKLGTVLDIQNGTIRARNNVQVFELNKTNAQKWKLSSVSTVSSKNYVNITNGTYVIQTSLSAGKAMDIDNASANDKANLQIFDKNDTLAQSFMIKKVADKEYQIVSQKSGKALDLAGKTNQSGTNVWQYSKDNSNTQIWKFIDAGNGYYYIESKLGNVLEVANGSTNNGANVQIATWGKNAKQKWKLVKKSDMSDFYSIMGTTSTTASQMANYFTAKGGKYPYSDNKDVPTIKDFCQIYIDECKVEGVKAEVAFAQAMMETGFLRFGGDVKKEQYNFAGLGATGNGASGNGFKSIRIGIRAQVQHLKAYASKENLKQACVDGRYNYVTKGVSPYVEWLGQKESPTGAGWATGANYGYNIVNLYIKPLLNTSK